jgi:putative toxin-antitoxin system antitoxin component (TIGR02293 family)
MVAAASSPKGLPTTIFPGVAEILFGTLRSKAANRCRETLARARNGIEVHEIIMGGLPLIVMDNLVASSNLDRGEVLEALGISARTLQRYSKERKDKPLDEEHSDRAWRYAALLAQATRLLGTRDAAEEWFNTPAMSLEYKRPIELMSTSVGAQSVERLLGQIEYGVYV